MDFFFYGTLIDDEVRAAVLPGSAAGLTPVSARLPGWRRVCIRGRAYPAVVPRSAAATDGILLRGLPPPLFDRLVDYEGAEYDLRDCLVETPDGAVTARVFAAARNCRVTALEWDFERWRRRDKRRVMAALRGGPLR
tara:strand:- start:356 stop:766 length:411 start_codon:yes stop_codon:yes gene_type:complete